MSDQTFQIQSMEAVEPDDRDVMAAIKNRKTAKRITIEARPQPSAHIRIDRDGIRVFGAVTEKNGQVRLTNVFFPRL